MANLSNIIPMSVTGGFVVAAVLLVRPLMRRWGTHSVLILLWMCVWVCLMIPFRPSSPISAYNAARNVPVLAQMFTVGGEIAAPSIDSDTAEQLSGMEEEATPGIFPVLSVVWLIGVGAMLCGMAVMSVLLRLRFREAIPRLDYTARIVGLRRRVRVRQSSRTVSPITYGVLRPRIILPFTLSDGNTIDYVLCHETQHIRTWDALFNFLWMGALMVHWFNPLVWLAWILLRRDIEARCDARVLRELGTERQRGYAQTLLDMAQTRQRVLPLAFGASAVGSRIKSILSYRPATKRGLCASLAVVLCFVVLFATNPARAVIAEQIANTLDIPTAPNIPTSTPILSNEGFNLYKLEYSFNEQGTRQKSYVLCDSFAALDDVFGYFSKNYSTQESETIRLNLKPENFTIAWFSFAYTDPITSFSIQKLPISINIDGRMVDFEVLDRSTCKHSSGENNIAVMRYITSFVFTVV